MDYLPRQIFIFSVGINHYKSKEIENLSGCERDVKSLQQLLKRHLNIPDHHCECLINDAATRDGIINGFRKHFSQLEEGGVAIFHYSGHGSWEWTTPAFEENAQETPGGKNEMILSYDYAVDRVLGIADKELRYLISEIQYPKEGTPKKIHFIGLMDCCFSGSMFRRVKVNLGGNNEEEVLNIRKNAPNDPAPRTLSQYLEGQYWDVYLEKGKVTLPKADFVLLSASSHGEPASEDANGGLFTQALIRVLDHKVKDNRYPSYAELHFLISTSIHRETNHQQHPYLEYSGNFNPFQCFAMNGASHFPLLPQVSIRDNVGIVNLGAIHGLEFRTWENIDIPVYRRSNRLLEVGTAKLQQVQVEHSTITFVPNDEFDAIYDREALVGLHARPLGINYVIIAEDEQDIAVSLQRRLLEKIKAKGLESLFLEEEKAEYSILFYNDKIAIYNFTRLIVAFKGAFEEESFDFIIDVLQKSARWEQIRKLDTPKNSSVEVEKIKFSFSYYNYEGEKKKYEVAPTEINGEGISEIVISFDEQAENNGVIPYEIRIGHNQLKAPIELYFYLVHLGKKYSINQKNETLKSLLPLQYDSKYCFEYISKNHNLGLGIPDKGTKETTDIFVLLASAEPLKTPYLFNQEGFGTLFGKEVPISIPPKNLTRDDIRYKKVGDFPVLWAVKKLIVKLIKN